MRKLFVPVLALLTTAVAAAGLVGCATANPGSGATPSVTGTTATTGSGSPSAGPTGPLSSGGMVPVVITRSGGIAGVRQSLSVAADGSWVYADLKSGQTSRGTFTTEQRAALVAVMTNPQLVAELSQHSTSGVCNDGYVYGIQIGGETFTFNDCSAGDLAKQLVNTLATATPL